MVGKELPLMMAEKDMPFEHGNLGLIMLYGWRNILGLIRWNFLRLFALIVIIQAAKCSLLQYRYHEAKIALISLPVFYFLLIFCYHSFKSSETL